MTSLEQCSIDDPPHHRWAVPALAGVEMWERFSFYGMQAILIYHLYHHVSEGGLGIDRAQATA